jgi:hypothetical protein
MIVLVAGMPRSGSTFSFNVVRDVLIRRGGIYQEASSSIMDELAKSNGAAHVILKAHEIDDLGLALAPHGAIKIICTVRNPEDAAASWITTFGFSEDQAISYILRWIELYSKIKPYALTIEYDLIDRYPIIAARRIGRYLSSDVSWKESWETARRHSKVKIKEATDRMDKSATGVRDISFSWYDTTTFFHRNHVSSIKSRSADERLPLEQAERIRRAFSDRKIDV